MLDELTNDDIRLLIADQQLTIRQLQKALQRVTRELAEIRKVKDGEHTGS